MVVGAGQSPSFVPFTLEVVALLQACNAFTQHRSRIKGLVGSSLVIICFEKRSLRAVLRDDFSSALL